MRISREIRNPMSQIDCGSSITRDDKSSNVLQRPQSKSRAVCRRVRERRVRFSTCDTSRLKRVLASRGSLSRGLQYTFFLHTSRLKRVFALLSATKRYKNRQILILHKRRHAFHSNERQSEPSWLEPKCVAFEKYAIWPMCQKRRHASYSRNTQSSFWRFSLFLIFTTNLPSRNQNIENLSCFINKKWRQDAKTLEIRQIIASFFRFLSQEIRKKWLFWQRFAWDSENTHSSCWNLGGNSVMLTARRLFSINADSKCLCTFFL